MFLSNQWRADAVILLRETLQLVGGMWWHITGRMENTSDKVIISSVADGPKLRRSQISCVRQNIFHLTSYKCSLCLYKQLPLTTLVWLKKYVTLINCSIMYWCSQVVLPKVQFVTTSVWILRYNATLCSTHREEDSKCQPHNWLFLLSCLKKINIWDTLFPSISLRLSFIAVRNKSSLLYTLNYFLLWK